MRELKAVEVFQLAEEVSRLRRSEEEIGHRDLVVRPEYRAGIVVFRSPGARPDDPGDPKEITHADLDVLVHVLGGGGTLTVRGEARDLVGGMAVRLPAGTPHDFAAGEGEGGEDLVLFYAMIRVKAETPESLTTDSRQTG